MTTVDIAQALVTEPPLIWLVRFTGLAFAALAVAAVRHALLEARKEKP